jgi:TfoX/Sxy family transcriptional regulator of competence genes
VAYAEQLAARIRQALGSRTDVAERRMMGGLAFMLRGHMCCGVQDDVLIVRVGAEQHAAALTEPHVRPMDFTGRPLKGFVFVDPAGIRTKACLAKWVRCGVEFATSLPAKGAGTRRAKRRRA